MKPIRSFFAVLALVVLTGCYGTMNSTLSALNHAEAIGSPFTKQLTIEYRTLANHLNDRAFDRGDALHFARKGLAAASGIVVMPEVLDDWDLSDKHLTELALARNELADALENGGRVFVPVQAAQAQVQFDCWAEQQERIRATDEASCKGPFLHSLKIMQDAVEAQKPTPAEIAAAPVEETFPSPVTAAEKGALAPLEQAMFIVFFDWDKSDITGGANDVLDAVAEELKHRTDVRKINIVGHADTSGSKKYNMRLSLRRGEAVKKGLAGRGISTDKLAVDGRGEEELLVPTADNVREPANRRARITLE